MYRLQNTKQHVIAKFQGYDFEESKISDYDISNLSEMPIRVKKDTKKKGVQDDIQVEIKKKGIRKKGITNEYKRKEKVVKKKKDEEEEQEEEEIKQDEEEIKQEEQEIKQEEEDEIKQEEIKQEEKEEEEEE